MPPRMNYSTELGHTRCRQLVLNKRKNRCYVDPTMGCWLFTGSLNTDGYGQIYTKRNQDLGATGRHAQTAFLLHIVSFVATHRADHPNKHISHLCNQPKCFNPDHLTAEAAQVNNARKGCPGPITCLVHGHVIVDICAHIPHCIRGPRQDIQCCLALKESDPVGWATQTRGLRSLLGSGGSLAEELQQPYSSSDFSGAKFVEEAAHKGLI